MITRVTLSLDPVDVELIDRLAALMGSNRSEQMRTFLAELRPTLRQTVETLEAALRQRDDLLRVVGEADVLGLQDLLPEVERVQNAVLGAMARLEGKMAAAEVADPRPSNHGGHTPTPPPTSHTPEEDR